ncbi:alpha/beta hydrolase fold-domain-containing protein [Pavlovales sp. CCMP2436]|nr:alpha/beta hydrolase fold-domain-containing protein [Pavlovales sp. CCMP2436]|mmetsp:Transcript_42967/g.105957  ORF Transcript_42967/g.105957 Transcript_42967/m.105957 type:complete len:489 (+) Transcript_42967:127-1593(+)
MTGALSLALRESLEADAAAERTRLRLHNHVRVRTEEIGAEGLVEIGVAHESFLGMLAMVAAAIAAAPLGWLWFAVCFLPQALVLSCAYLCGDGDGRMRAIRGMMRAMSRNVPRKLIALQRVTDIAPLVPMLRWVQLDLFGGGGVATCPAAAIAGDGEWLWPTALGEGDAIGASRSTRAFSRPPALSPPFAERRVVLYVHGGAFVLCNPATHRSLTSNLARHLGVSVLATTYRRAPQHSHPEALDGLLSLYRTLLACFPPHGIMLAGESAGANLALELCLRTAQLRLPAPAGLILMSPWVALDDMSSESWTRNERSDYLPADLARLFAEAYAGGRLRDEGVSPLYAHDLSSLPRTLVVYGEGECLADQQRRMVERLREASVPTSAFACPGAMHGFPLFADAAYWGWSKHVPQAVGARAEAETVGLRGAGGADGADSAAAPAGGVGAGLLGEDTPVDPTVPGAVQAFYAMRDFAREALAAARIDPDEQAR